MKYLVIIATRDFNQVWKNQLDVTYVERTVYILNRGEGRSEQPFKELLSHITNKLQDKSDFELGVIFHEKGGSEEANSLREMLRTSLNGKLAFCEWYSSTLTQFWNESDADANFPYNNLKKAWKDDNGNKEEAFDAVWNFFLGDTREEELVCKIFELLRAETSGAEAISRAIEQRDTYLLTPKKN